MLGDITQAKNVYNVCGRTDMRKGIRGLTALVQQNYQMDPTDSSLFLFCGKPEPTESPAVGTGWLYSVEQAVIQRQIPVAPYSGRSTKIDLGAVYLAHAGT